MDRNRLFVVIMLALGVISLGITLGSTSHAIGYMLPGGGVP